MMLDLSEYIDRMTEEYDDFVEAIEVWTEKPTTRNKKRIIEKQKIFNATKSRVMCKVRDFLVY